MKPSRNLPTSTVYVVTWALVLLVSSCTGGLQQLRLGMKASEASEVMPMGPTRTEPFEQGYMAWYYGEDTCLLLKEDTVVERKDSLAAGTVLTPTGMVDERILPQCLPPGVERPERRGIRMHSPVGGMPMQGWGGRVSLRGAGTP